MYFTSVTQCHALVNSLIVIIYLEAPVTEVTLNNVSPFIPNSVLLPYLI